MAQLTNAQFSINGNPVTVYSHFTLTQNIFDHHHFILVCPTEAIDGKEGMFTNSKGMIGATFGARIESVAFNITTPANGNLLFQGIVTGVETSKYSGHQGDLIITGYSPTIILDAGPHCKSWLNKPLKNIADDVLSKFPKNLIPANVKPVNSEPFGFQTQYKESAWAFLQRIAASKGEWLYWDGRNLVIGAPKRDKKVDLVFGSNLSRFNLSLQTRPTNIKLTSWDFQNGMMYQSEPQNVKEKAGLNLYGEQVLQASQTVYNTQPKQFNLDYTLSKGQQDDLATLKSAMESARMVQFNGQSGHPGANIGEMVSVSGSNIFSDATEGYGEYLITGISHSVDAMGNYSNQFTAVPSSIKVPPISMYQPPVCETQSAIVTDNHDTHGLGRIRVKFHWMGEGEKTPWIRVTSPHGGGGKGHFFIPEIKEEVIIGFEGDSANKPYVIGTVYHGQANNSFSNAGNDVKTTQTRSGVRTTYDDAKGSFYAQDKGTANFLLDGAGNAITNANENHQVNAGTNHATSVGKGAESLFTMDKNGNINFTGKESFKITIGSSVLEMKKDGTISFNGKDVHMTMTASANIKAKNNNIKGITTMDEGDVFIN